MANSAPWSFDLISFMIGFIIAGFLGNLLQRIRRERGIMQAPDRPMNVPTVATPNNVKAIAREAFGRFIRLWILFFISVAIIAAFIYLLMQQ